MSSAVHDAPPTIPPFAIERFTGLGRCEELRVSGELDMIGSRSLAEALARASEEGRDVIVDLNSCVFIDSTGVAAIIFGARRLDARGRRLRLLIPEKGQPQRQLKLLGIADSPLACASREDALLDFRTQGQPEMQL
ncbi:MAG TPA: STAS domain-containing protein [Solirubrobacterales bacterium]|jgi:anti-anti-sigma factor